MRPWLIKPREQPPGARLDPPAFFQAADTAFQRAVQSAGGAVECDYCIGGYHIQLRFAGPALVPALTRALAHLSAPAAAQPDLTIQLWETASTGIAPPPPAWDYDDFGGSGIIRRFSTDQYLTSFQLGTNSLSLVDTQRNLGTYWIKSSDQIPYWERGAPLRALLTLWMSRHARMLAHAGAVGLPEGGVLLAGAGGTGKSNTSLATLASDLRYASDDFSLLALEPEPTVFSLYATGKTKAADLEQLPFLRPSVSNSGQLADEKALFFIYEHWPEKLLARFPLRAILLPHITANLDSRLRPASAADGLNALAPSTLDLAPSVEADGFRLLVEVFRRVPSYHLDLGTDRAQPAALILSLLKQ